MSIFILLEKKVRPFIPSTQDNLRTAVEITNGQGGRVCFPAQTESEFTLGAIHLEDNGMIDGWICRNAAYTKEDPYNDTRQANIETDTLLRLESLCLDTSLTYAINKDSAIEMAKKYFPLTHGVHTDNDFKTLEETSSKLRSLINIPSPNNIEGVKFNQYYTYSASW